MGVEGSWPKIKLIFGQLYSTFSFPPLNSNRPLGLKLLFFFFFLLLKNNSIWAKRQLVIPV